MSEQTQAPAETVRPGEPPRAPIEERVVPGPAPAATPVEPISSIPRKTPPPENKDGFREIVETIVFVVVLVLLLKTFLAEAFVIPTGSMATTLLGYHIDATCEECGYRFRVNAAEEAERKGAPVEGWVCPNCRFHNHRHKIPRQEEAP
jgi:hypothetical protein